MRKIRVGFTVQINDKTDSFWVNGIKQNAVTLQESFLLCDNVEDSFLVNLGKLHDYKDTAWEPFADKLINFQQAIDKLDVLVTATVTPTAEMVNILNAKNIAMIKHVMGNEYEIFSESMLFKDEASNSYGKRKGIKAVWISDHLFDENKDFLEVLTDSKAYIGPYIWSPRFIEQHSKLNAESNKTTGLYVPRGNEQKLLSTFEPNINIQKTCLTPMLIAEKFYKKAPHMLDKLSVFGADPIKKKKFFIEYAKDFETYKDKKMFFEARYPMAWCLLQHTDIVIAHQHNLALNYAYFDAAWLGFPVLHNSHMLKDLAFYYPDWDAEVASDILIDICKNFDSTHEQYREESKKVISRYLWDNPKNVNGYAELLEIALS
jgi:hypothetical protein